MSQSPNQNLASQQVIALVDDDRNILATVSIALQAEGYVTRLYSDGEAALNALLENPPDLAVFDIKMPKMDGMELLGKLRKKWELPVIFLTSKDDEQDEEAGLAQGADDYIAKPLTLKTLRETLAKYLASARPGPTGPVSPESAPEESGEVVNLSQLREITQGDPELEKELIDLFLTDTRALLDAVPVPDPVSPGGKLSLGGEMPSIINPPPGCAFHPRCRFALPRCRIEPPRARQVGDARVACHRAEELEL